MSYRIVQYLESRFFIAVLTFVILAPLSFALKEKGGTDPLDTKAFSVPELRVVSVAKDFSETRARVPNSAQFTNMLLDLGVQWNIKLDERTGRPSLISGGAIPWIPGPANSLAWDNVAPGCNNIHCLRVDIVEQKARTYLARHSGVFQLDDYDLVLSSDGSGPRGNSLYFLRFFLEYHGIPVKEASVDFRLNGGNLIQVATNRVGTIDLDPLPRISADNAWQLLYDYLGEAPGPRDAIKDPGTLQIMPMTPRGKDPNHFEGEVGSFISYALVWQIKFQRDGVIGYWRALVDAHTGELLEFVDENRYGQAHGVVYPGDNHTGAVDRPFPFLQTDLPFPDDYTDDTGAFPGNNVTVDMTQGLVTWINDQCASGDVSVTTTTGDADYAGSGAGIDCDLPSPNPGGDGNTMSARTQFYHLTTINIKARTYFPANAWLTTNHMNVNVNISPWCNATSGGGTLSFYMSDVGCWNTGEIPGVSMHEWGHSWDDFDGSGGDSPPVETRADWTAILQTHDSCTGRGFWTSQQCTGFGDPCLDCTGVRDCDYTQHVSNTPWTPANHGTFWSCSGGTYFGPCGLEDHCESSLSTQALWEFVLQDLPFYSGMDMASAWQLADRLFYESHPQLGDMYSCTLPTSDGCSANTLYTLMMAIDDDGDGVGNGTPHAEAIFAALDRHNIACGLVTDPQNQNQTTCPTFTPDPPVLTSSSTDVDVTLNWGAITNATRYFVFRNVTDCDAGYTKIATVTVPTTTYIDTGVALDNTYYYRIQAANANDACVTAMSNCETQTPRPCSGIIEFDAALYNCSDTVQVTLIDSNIPGAPATITVDAWSSTDPTIQIITLTNTPPGSADYIGTLTTTTAPPGPSEVMVSHGDLLYIQYIDADYCGVPDVVVEETVPVDCQCPVISNVQAINVTGYSATITWDTDEPADSTVWYDDFTPPTTFDFNATLVTSHSMPLTGLSECTDYWFYVGSTDGAGNGCTDDNGGAWYTFSTLKNTSPTYASLDVPIAITDNATFTSDLVVTDNQNIVDINVIIDTLTHTYDGDLDIYLIAPDATRVELSTGNGGGSSNYIGTIFDDEAATPITGGTAPFTGSFQPEGFLSVLYGISALGTWTLEISDTAGGDIGTLTDWSIQFEYPAAACGPNASYDAHALVADTCSSGGPGDNDGVWDAGESVQFSLDVNNDGTVDLTGITVTMTSPTPGVVMTDGLASYNDISFGTIGTSLSPHFTVFLPETLNCGDTVTFDIQIDANEGTWVDSFTQVIGFIPAGLQTLFSDDFEGAVNWTFTGTGEWEIGAPQGLGGDSGTPDPVSAFGGTNVMGNDLSGSGTYLGDYETNIAGSTATLTNPIDCSLATGVQLNFKRWLGIENNQWDHAIVYVSNDGAAWTQVWANGGTSFADVAWMPQSFDISAVADNEATVYIRFQIDSDGSVQYCGWNIDDILVEGNVPQPCQMNTCVTGGCAMISATNTPDGATTFCAGGSVNLAAAPVGGIGGFSYTWAPGGEITATINVTASGSYSCTVEDLGDAGCIEVTPVVVVTMNPLPTPTITPDGPTTFCAGGSVNLASSVAVGYLWAPGGSTLQTINVTASGTYTVTITDGNGCLRQTTVDTVVTVNALPAAPTITPTNNCPGTPDSTLVSSAAAGYLWAPGGSTLQTIVVPNDGTLYTVTVTDGNGCQNTSAPYATPVGCPLAPPESSDVAGNGDAPMLVIDAAGNFDTQEQVLADSYNIYEGDMGAWGVYSNQSCWDAGAIALGRAALNMPMAAGSHWYLISASNTVGESRAGVDSGGVDHVGTCGANP